MSITQPLKIHGGKHDLAKWIVSLMPPRCKNPNKPDPSDPGWLHYVEPYFGGGSVMLAMDPEGISEVVNDLNWELTNFWSVLQLPPSFEEFRRQMQATPFSKREYENAEVRMPTGVDRKWYNVDAAVDFFIRCRQSLSGRMKGFAEITKNRTRRGMNEQVSAWLNCIEGLPAVHERLKRVLILNSGALSVIRKHDGLRTLFYLDPPYLHETRKATEVYGEFEMTEEDHAQILRSCQDMEGKFLLSGYRSDLYDTFASHNCWNRYEKKIHNHASGGKKKRIMTECVWTNF